MSGKTAKGIVLESSPENIILLTGSGEFLKLPARGKSFTPGVEVEVAVPERRKLPFMLRAACIAAALLLAALCLIQPARTAPQAYLALDINPGIVLSLDKEAVVINVEALNAEGERILAIREVKGIGLLEALDLLLDEAFLSGFLSAGRDNVIIVSLAAPENFAVSEDELRASLTKQLLRLGVDTYLKIITAEVARVREAKRLDLPLNALLLGEEMRDMRNPESRSPIEGTPPQQVQDFLQGLILAEIFNQGEFVPGEAGRIAPPVNPPVDQRNGDKKDNPVPGPPGAGQQKIPGGLNEGDPAP